MTSRRGYVPGVANAQRDRDGAAQSLLLSDPGLVSWWSCLDPAADVYHPNTSVAPGSSEVMEVRMCCCPGNIAAAISRAAAVPRPPTPGSTLFSLVPTTTGRLRG